MIFRETPWPWLTLMTSPEILRAMPGYHRRTIFLVAILVIASVVRLYHLGQSSLWYDEVVTMRLARTESPAALFRLLGQIDATRAPLHPLLLQGWVALSGPSDTSGRAFSVLCGIVTIGLVYWIGLRAFDVTTGLWASWLCAISPLLVYYSREARMYMWLVLVTCLAWGLLFSHSLSPRPWKLVLYGLTLVAIVYSHPLGLLMVGALGLASVLFRQSFQDLVAGLVVHPYCRRAGRCALGAPVSGPSPRNQPLVCSHFGTCSECRSGSSGGTSRSCSFACC